MHLFHKWTYLPDMFDVRIHDEFGEYLYTRWAQSRQCTKCGRLGYKKLRRGFFL